MFLHKLNSIVFIIGGAKLPFSVHLPLALLYSYFLLGELLFVIGGGYSSPQLPLRTAHVKKVSNSEATAAAIELLGCL